MKLAAIDLGTNSFHLVIVETSPRGGFRVVESEKEMVRLGEGGADMKLLSEAAIDRGIAALQRFKALCSARRAQLVKAVATSAVREAENKALFLRRAKIEAGIEVDVISGHEEGRLIYLGAQHALPIAKKKIFLLDIGGGSAEYVLGDKGKPRYITSLKLGAIRLTKKFNLAESPSARDLARCRKHIAGELAVPGKQIRAFGSATAVGTSGTIQSVASMIAARRKSKVAGADTSSFTREELDEAVDLLLEADGAQARAKIAGLDAKRADIIVAGALVLQESMRLLEIEEMMVSPYALREGLILDTIRADGRGASAEDIRGGSVFSLAERCDYDEMHAAKVASLAVTLFDQTRRLHGLSDMTRQYLYFAAILHDIGYHVSHSEHHKHSYYLIRNSELLGFTSEEIEIIANVARYHRKSHPKLKHEGFARLASDEHRETVRKLAGILRIADGLDRGHTSVIKSLSTTQKGGVLAIRLARASRRGDGELEIWGAERKKALFEEVFGISVVFTAEHAPATGRSLSNTKRRVKKRVS